MKRYPIICLILILLGSGCESVRKIHFKTMTFSSGGLEKDFEMAVPKGYVSKPVNNYPYLIKKLEYPDSSILYISLDITFNNSPNRENWKKCSDVQAGSKCERGTQPNGKYWRELLVNDLVLGYYDADKSRMEMFDKALSSLLIR